MFNEDNTVEQMLIEAATQSSWQYVKSQDIPRSSDSVLVESWLLEALVRLNPITRQQAEQVIYKLRAAITCVRTSTNKICSSILGTGTFIFLISENTIST